MRWLIANILGSLFFTPFLASSPLDINVAAEAAVMVNAKTGKVIFEKNAHQRTFPASTTKIATALLVLSKYRERLGDLLTAEREALVSISPEAKKQSKYKSPIHWIETGSTHIGIKRGEQLSLYELLHALLLVSANDAANVIAQSLGGTIPKYMEEVNQYLLSIGCHSTHFSNPHGLHHPEHYSTAYDLAIMAQKGLEDPIFRRIVATVRYTCPETNLQEERTFVQSNLLLRKGAHFYPRAIGVKTGYTQMAGKNLVAAAQSDDREIIAVALGYRGNRSELYYDVRAMFESAFNEQKMRRTILKKGEQKLTTKVAGTQATLKTYLTENLYYDFYPSEEGPVKLSLSWKIPPLPIAPHTIVGSVRVIDDHGNILKEQPLLAANLLKPSLVFKTRSLFSLYWKFTLILLLSLSALMTLGIKIRRRLI